MAKDAAQAKTVTPAAAPVPAPAAAPVRTAVPPGRVQLQSLKASSPSDPAEKEAEATARKIMRLRAPEPTAGAGPRPSPQSPYVARFHNTIARKAEGQPNVASNVAAEISASTASGSPLPASVRRFMEPRFRANFSNVRVHTGERSARLNRQLSAQAFTVGNQIFFGRDRFRPESTDGQELLAHELTHTIQQGAAVQQGTAVQRSVDVTVTQQSPAQVQRLGLSDALDYFADKANLIPGFRMFTIILGVNPINMSRVERSAANILRAVIEIIPGGGLITQALDNHGVFDRVGAWVEQQISSLGMTGSVIRQAINRFLDSLSWTDIFDLGGVWDRAKRIFTEPIDRIFSFISGLVSGIIRFIKEAILRPLAKLAEGTRGYDLLKAVLGYDPVTGDPYPRNAETLIGGFMKLIGQEEIWQNIQRSGAVARAWAWFQGALSGLLGFVRQIPSLFVQAFRSLEIADIILVPRAFAKIASVFGGFIGQFFSWAGNTIWNLLEIIFSVVAPNVMPYLRRAAGAFRTILRNPIGFIGNLVRAGLLGFRQFAANFLTHLRASLIGWLTGAMSGANIYIPQGFTLREIIKFVLSVLGLTWQNIRQKLVRVIGETAVRALETGFDIVMTLVTQGPAAAWEKIQETLSNLRDLVMEQIMTFVRDRVVQAAITRLVTSLNPAGAFIQAIIAIYNTVMFFVERLRQIAQVAMSFIDSIAAIASGALAPAANRVEQTMAGLLTLVISFLARIAGLGRVSDAVTNVIDRVRQPIDRALDRVVEWIVAQARRLGRLIAGTATGQAAPAGARPGPGAVGRTINFGAAGESHRLWVEIQGNNARLMVASVPMSVPERLQWFRDNIARIAEADRPSTLQRISRADQLQGSADSDADTLVRQVRGPQPAAQPAGGPGGVTAQETRLEQQEETLASVISEIYELFGLNPDWMAAGLRAMTQNARQVAERQFAGRGRQERFPDWAAARAWLEDGSGFQQILRRGSSAGNDLLAPVTDGVRSVVTQSRAQGDSRSVPELVTALLDLTIPYIHEGAGLYGALRRDLLQYLFTGAPPPTASAIATYALRSNPDTRRILFVASADLTAEIARFESLMQGVDRFLKTEQSAAGVASPPGLLGNWSRLRDRVRSTNADLEAARGSASPDQMAGYERKFRGYQRQMRETIGYAENTLGGRLPRLVGVELKPPGGGSEPDLLLEDMLDGQRRLQVREIKNWTEQPGESQVRDMVAQVQGYFPNYTWIVLEFTNASLLRRTRLREALDQIDTLLVAENARRAATGRPVIVYQGPVR